MKYNVQNDGQQSLAYQAPELVAWSVVTEKGFADSSFQQPTEDAWEWN